MYMHVHTCAATQVKEADLVRQDHIRLMAVGVGGAVNNAELTGIADHHRDVFKVADFDNLPTITQNIMERACVCAYSYSSSNYHHCLSLVQRPEITVMVDWA